MLRLYVSFPVKLSRCSLLLTVSCVLQLPCMRARTLSAVRRIRCRLGSANLLEMGFGRSMSVLEGVSRGGVGARICSWAYLQGIV